MNSKHLNRKLVIPILSPLILAIVLLAGCNLQRPSSETGTITNVVMSASVDENGRPVNPTNVFSEDAPGFYCSFRLSGFPVGAKLEVKWIYVSGDPEAQEITGEDYVAETQTAEISKTGSGYTYTVYGQPGVPDYKWPKGNYKVVISVDGIEKATTTFTVQ
jgi:hypothetical protein